MKSQSDSSSARVEARMKPSDCVMEDWTEDPTKLLGICFGADLQTEENWVEVSIRITRIVKTRS